VRALVEAGRGRVATALYLHGECVEAARLATVAELVGLIVEPTLVLGELSAEARDALATHASARMASPALSLRRGGVLVELGWRRQRSGDPGNPNAVDAVYVS
jgi:hypothetical protein